MGRDKPRSGKAVEVVKNLHIEYPGFALIVGEKKIPLECYKHWLGLLKEKFVWNSLPLIYFLRSKAK